MKSALGMAATCILTLVTSLASASEPYDLVDAVLWQQRSLEYAALTEQTYRQATLALEDALARCDRKRGRLQGCSAVAVEQLGMTPSALSRLAPAVVLDIDETVLDNSRFQAEMQRAGEDYTSASWARWLEESSAEGSESRFGRLAVPGAAAFTRRAQALKVDVFYISNRECPSQPTVQDCPALQQTMRLMKRLGFARADDPSAFLFSSPTLGSDKTSRREQVAKLPRRIVMLLGDDLGDFVAKSTRDQLRAGQPVPIQAHVDAQWGRRWFVLPNPSYGSWEKYLTAEASATCLPPNGDGQAERHACRQIKAAAKDAMLRGFAAGQVLRVATWNLGWHVAMAELAPWRQVCSRAYVRNASSKQWEPVADGTPGSTRGWDIKESRPQIVGNDLSVMPPCGVYLNPAHQGIEVTEAAYARRDAQLGKLLSAQVRPDVIAFQEVSGVAAVREALGTAAADYNVCSFEPQYKVQRLAFAWRKQLGDALEPCRAIDAVSLPQLPPDSRVRPAFTVTLKLGDKRVRLATVHLKSGCVSALDGRGRLDENHGAGDPCPTLQQQIPPLEDLAEHLQDGVDAFVVLGDFNRNLWHEANGVAGDEAVRSDGTTDLTKPMPNGVLTRNLLREVFDGVPAASGAVLLGAECPGSQEVNDACHASKTSLLSAAQMKVLTDKTGLGCRNPVGLDQMLVSPNLADAVRSVEKVAIGQFGVSLSAKPPQFPDPLLAVSDHCPTVAVISF